MIRCENYGLGVDHNNLAIDEYHAQNGMEGSACAFILIECTDERALAT